MIFPEIVSKMIKLKPPITLSFCLISLPKSEIIPDQDTWYLGGW